MKTGDAFFLGFFIGCVLSMVVNLLTTTPDDRWHNEAVRKGHAEYYLDQNFERRWRWK